MPARIRYKVSNRLKADNTAFYRPSGINPITGNPIYRDSFTHIPRLTALIPDDPVAMVTVAEVAFLTGWANIISALN